MAWNRRYSAISYVKSALWIVPLLALVTELVTKHLTEHLTGGFLSQWLIGLHADFLAVNAAEAHAILDRVFTLNLSCLVFTFGSLLVAIQVAGGQYTPRIIATTLLRDNVIRWIIGLFVFNLLWVHRTMVQLGTELAVSQFQVFFATLLGLASLIAFILLIDYAAKLLRPVTLVGRVGEQGVAVIDSVYPYPTTDLVAHTAPPTTRRWQFPSWGRRGEPIASTPAARRGPPDGVIDHRGKSGIVLAVNLRGLVAEAQRVDCVLDFVVQVGDFLCVDEPVFYVYGNLDAINEQRLRDLVALGSERTMEQDPMFAFRIVVDIALKALSPAINDPTTAVLAIDQLNRLLRMVGRRSLRDHEILDELGQPRVVFRTPNWEDFVHISFREIRQCGAGSLQVARRLRAMIENLMRSLPPHRHPALLVELDLLDRAIALQYGLIEDAVLARIADSQGLGGAASAKA